MNDEIKEKIKAYYIENDIDKVLDYITNLQQENQRLKELCDKYEKEHSTEFKIWKDERQQLRDYKSRNEKAIDYIKILLSVTIKVDGEDKTIMTYNKPLYDLLDILQGVSNENSNE